MKTTETQRHGDSDDRDINEITGAIIGAAINFHSAVLKDGVIRRAL